jgi:hypothetical protein
MTPQAKEGEGVYSHGPAGYAAGSTDQRNTRCGGSPRFDRVAPHYNARGADANWFSLPDQGSVESALLDRERRGVQP